MVLGLVLLKMYGHTLLESGPWHLASSRCLTMDSSLGVANVAHTSSSVKDLIVACSGVDEEQWEGTYVKPTGGMFTVRSELGEPVHNVASRAVKLWKEFD